MASYRVNSLLRQPGVWRCFSTRRSDESIMNVFDRKAKRRQRNRAALNDNVAVYDYLKDEASHLLKGISCLMSVVKGSLLTYKHLLWQWG